MHNKEVDLKSYPKYLSLRDKIKDRIVSEEFSPGDKLPTERELASGYNVSRIVIRQAIDELAKNGTLIRFRGRGTYLNPDLQNVKSLKSDTKPLGFLFVGQTEGTNYLKDDIIHALSHELAKDNNHLVLMSIPESVRQWNELPLPIRDESLSGLFIMGNFSLEIVNIISEKIPAMLVGKHMLGANLSSISPDNMAAIRIVFEHLYTLGHRRIGYFGGPVSHAAYQERLCGYKQMLEEHNMAFNDEITHICPCYGETPTAKIHSSLRKVSAFICDNESKAAKIINMAQQEGIKVPEELSVIGFGNNLHASLINPPLTTASYDGAELASLAVKYLSGDTKWIKSRLLIPVRLFERDSVSKPFKGKKSIERIIV